MLNNDDKDLKDNLETCEEETQDAEKNVEDVVEENLDTSTEEDGVSEEEKLKCQNRKLEDEVSKLQNELEALKDRLSRTVAEYDNFRKRTAKEKEGIYTDACEDILKEMLPVLDNLERAVSVDGSVEDVKKGVEMTIKQFNTSLEKLNVEEIATDEEFDPNIHNAVMHVEDDSLGKNQVAEVFQKGYKRGDKVLRYSMVKVAN